MEVESEKPQPGRRSEQSTERARAALESHGRQPTPGHACSRCQAGRHPAFSPGQCYLPAVHGPLLRGLCSSSGLQPDWTAGRQSAGFLEHLVQPDGLGYQPPRVLPHQPRPLSGRRLALLSFLRLFRPVDDLPGAQGLSSFRGHPGAPRAAQRRAARFHLSFVVGRLLPCAAIHPPHRQRAARRLCFWIQSVSPRALSDAYARGHHRIPAVLCIVLIASRRNGAAGAPGGLHVLLLPERALFLVLPDLRRLFSAVLLRLPGDGEEAVVAAQAAVGGGRNSCRDGAAALSHPGSHDSGRLGESGFISWRKGRVRR